MAGWGDSPWGGGSWGVGEDTIAPTGNKAQQQIQVKELQKLFGTDILFENDYALSSAGDFVLLSGIPNLRAAIYRRLFTRPGEYKFVPEYGVGIQSYVKRRRTPSVLRELKARIEEQLLRESRIDEVLKVSIERIANGIKINIAIRAAGRALRFTPFLFSEEQ